MNTIPIIDIVSIVILLMLIFTYIRLSKKEKYDNLDNQTITITKGMGCGLILILFIGFIWLSDSDNKLNKNSEFLSAYNGQYWIIEDDNVSIVKNPKTSNNKAQFMRNLVTVAGINTKIEILESKGVLSPWKLVNVYNDQGKVYAKGWVLAETIKKATRTK